jgi:hypothetical protein
MNKRVEGERLDLVLQRLRQAGETDRPGEVASKEFTDILTGVDERRSSGHDSLEAEIIDFIIPRIGEPSIFHSSRAITLLEYFLKDLLPLIDEGEEFSEQVFRVIKDEIDRQRDVLDRLQAGIAA